MKIRINKKCANPDNCKKCLKVCPMGVFIILPTDKFIPLSPNPPKSYKIYPMFSKVCNACMECVRTCPQSAISIDENE